MTKHANDNDNDNDNILLAYKKLHSKFVANLTIQYN